MKCVAIYGTDKVALVDDEDYEKVSAHKWYLLKPKNRHVIYVRANAPRSGGAPPRSIMLHNLIAGKFVDHKDRNGLNNTRANLRPCTSSQNSMNKKKQVGCVSKYKGVTYRKTKRRWRARIMHNGKLVHLGDFVSELDAANAYDVAASQLFGEFARTNNGRAKCIKEQ